MLLDIVGTTALSDWSLCLLHLEASSPNFFKRARKTLARASVRWCIRAAFWHKNRTWSKSIQIHPNPIASAMIIPTNFPQTWQFGFITASWTGKNRARLIARHLRFCDHVWKNLSKLRLKKQEDSWQVRIASPQILQSLCQNWCFHFANPGASYFLRTCCLCTSARSELSGKSMPSPSVSAKCPHFGIWDSHGFPWIPMDSHGFPWMGNPRVNCTTSTARREIPLSREDNQIPWLAAYELLHLNRRAARTKRKNRTVTTSESKRHKRDGKGFRKFLVTNENNEIRRGSKKRASVRLFLCVLVCWLCLDLKMDFEWTRFASLLPLRVANQFQSFKLYRHS